ncbi:MULTISPECIES: ABC transporter ATP-binding protein [Streptococcus]|uniref:ABC transporter ATP-binding protein n=1 Tax=Streptococcus TaxID=1301 RepID=UPI000CF36FA9|nr:ATP-binding cassette domain-containing protein [Streptococcus suis]MCL4921808.1 ATP-binding cassette domain-containing protein [Streptococcus suis]HEM6072373.1 ATP-binding cassette domain-containing protein [Streptococcus suis]HEM6184161.1 ATP-binding cassette domain-containing protein [Streptococcus suis]
MIISMKNVHYKRQGKTILEDINWEFRKGERWAILGLNGAGKSTLLRILMAEFWKTSGDLTVLGVEFGKGDIPSLRTKIGVVGSFLAERFPIDLTAEQIVLTGKYKSSILYREYGQTELDEAIDMLKTIKAEHLIGRTYASLSQGERLLHHIDHICQLPTAPAIIYVTHHAEEITDNFTHVLLLKDGKVLAQGPKEDILTPELLSDFYGNQVELIDLGEGRLFIKPIL